MTDCDVLIAGGGHNGLACAALLTRHGLKVLVVERKEAPSSARMMFLINQGQIPIWLKTPVGVVD